MITIQIPEIWVGVLLLLWGISITLTVMDILLRRELRKLQKRLAEGRS